MSNEPKIVLPDEKSRWRCARCGNLTRFDLTRASTVTEFWHADLAGVGVGEEEMHARFYSARAVGVIASALSPAGGMHEAPAQSSLTSCCFSVANGHCEHDRDTDTQHDPTQGQHGGQQGVCAVECGDHFIGTGSLWISGPGR